MCDNTTGKHNYLSLPIVSLLIVFVLSTSSFTYMIALVFKI